MGAESNIAWTDATHNFWRGCTKVNSECANCYAEKLVTTRMKGEWGKGAPRVRSKSFNEPLKWNKKPWVCDTCGIAQGVSIHDDAFGIPNTLCSSCNTFPKFHRRRVFSLSLGDWLDDEVPIEWLADMLDVIRRCQNLDFLLLTKRPENWHDLVEYASLFPSLSKETQEWLFNWIGGNTPSNIWLGVSAGTQESADKNIPLLLQIPAKVRFVSCEPMLEAVDFHMGSLTSDTGFNDSPQPEPPQKPYKPDWIIVGGESGPKARPFNVQWAQNTVAQCQAAGVACFVKQLGAFAVTANANADDWSEDTHFTAHGEGFAASRVMLHDSHGGDWLEWPEALRVRQFPRVTI